MNPYGEEMDVDFEEGEDPLVLKADRDLQELCSQIWDKPAIYHPILRRHPIYEYKKFIFVGKADSHDVGSHVLFGRGRKKEAAAWNLLAKALGKWSIVEFMEGPVERECRATDYYGRECYAAYPAIFNRDIVLVNGESQIFDTVSLYFVVTLLGPYGKPGIKEFEVQLEGEKNLSILQGILDLLGSGICLVPSDSCVRKWEEDFQNSLATERRRHSETVDSFLHLLEENYPQEKLRHAYKNLPRLPYGYGLKRYICEWLEGKPSDDLGLEMWLFDGRSEEVFQLLSREDKSRERQFEAKFSELLQVQFDRQAHRPFPHLSPAYQAFQKNKVALEKELDWFGKLRKEN